MRALALLLLLIPAVAAGQRFVPPKYTVAAGGSQTVVQGKYLVEAVGSRVCICTGTAVCTEATGQGQTSGPVAVCIPDGAALHMRLTGSDALVSVAAGDGSAVLTRWVP